MERKNKVEDLKFKAKKYTYGIRQYEIIRSLGESINTRKASLVEFEEDQINLLKNLVEFNNKSRPKSKEGKDKKRDTYESAYALYKGRHKVKDSKY